jgi:UDP-N-acetylmuramoyl-tripeptide--D-alanyl-D-alanine ligase
MIPMTLGEIAGVVGAEVRPPTPAAGRFEADQVTVSSVEFDSRKVTPGALFVALPGEHADGHDFAPAAARAGAVAVLGLHEVPDLPALVIVAKPPAAGARVTDGVLPTAMPLLAALSALAAHVAARLVGGGMTIIGITGSAGKTSTKDLIAGMLRGSGTVVAPPESFNNELGHPYTVLRADAATDFLVLELSARGVGHIAGLAAAAPPRIGAVLNVGSAHLGEFGSREAIALAKGELVEALPAAADGGVAVLNADDPLVASMASRTAAAVVRFGTGPDADVRAEGVALDPAARAAFTLVTPEGSAPVRLQVVGAHQVANALAAAAVGRAAGLDVVTVAEGLSAAGPASKWRMAVSELPGGVTLVNDAYNANPESMRAALDALASMAGDRRHWAVLGPMAELGPFAGDAHVAIGQAAARAGARVLAVGEAARGIADGARADPASHHAAPRWVPDLDAAAELLLAEVAAGDVVLVKASRSVGLERLALRLEQALPSLLAGTPPAGNPDGREAT